MTKLKPYPYWVCFDCAKEAGGSKPAGHACTVHIGKCDVCEQEKPVTQPRDFGYPKFEGHEE